jgi:hypothetical protein
MPWLLEACIYSFLSILLHLTTSDYQCFGAAPGLENRHSCVTHLCDRAKVLARAFLWAFLWFSCLVLWENFMSSKSLSVSTYQVAIWSFYNLTIPNCFQLKLGTFVDNLRCNFLIKNIWWKYKTKKAQFPRFGSLTWFSDYLLSLMITWSTTCYKASECHWLKVG